MKEKKDLRIVGVEEETMDGWKERGSAGDVTRKEVEDERAGSRGDRIEGRTAG